MKKVIVSILTVSTILGFNSCGNKNAAALDAADSTSISKVRVQQADEREVEQTANFTTTALPDVKNSIAPITPGRIRHILVEVGDKVVKGQRIVQMDATTQSSLQTQVDNLQATYQRISELYAVGGASKQDLDNTKAQLDVLENNLKNAQENTYLLSPLTGVVTARNYDDGDLFNGQQPVLTVMQTNPIKLTVNISESYFASIKQGMAVDVNFDALDDAKLTGKINLIYPTIDPATRTFSADVILPNASGKIHPGMFGRVFVNFGKKLRVLVPDRAVVSQPGSGVKFVYVLDNNTAHYREVTLGNRIGTEYEILTGLQKGETVITAGQTKLHDGSQVSVIQ
ncbi:MAG: efflux RND transporter periplasmic adaptor subunit [Prevotellaceae bacterium]|jgi:RND family efflux transporter MFP subunit|nr:efflux RND transporter periplasmic adaptor subunit [Prevotellaceae bacterium]